MHMGVRARDLFEVYILVYLLLTLGAHVPEVFFYFFLFFFIFYKKFMHEMQGMYT